MSLAIAQANSLMNDRMIGSDKISALSLGLSAMFAGMAFFYLSQWQLTAQHVPLIVFVLLPYLISWLLNVPLLRANRPYSRIAAGFSVVVLLFTALAYGTLFFGITRSTSGLALFAVPIYLLAGIAVMPGIANLFLFFQRRRR
jgi:hypothetical protein